MTDRVWIVSEGSRYEGGEVHSVHATRKSALVAAKTLLVQHAGRVEDMRKHWPDGLSSGGWDMKKKRGDVWVNNTDFIEIKEWTVTTTQKEKA